MKLLSKNAILSATLIMNSVCASELYLDLMKKCLSNTIYEDVSMATWSSEQQVGKYSAYARMNGLDHPVVAHTMIGMKRLNNLQNCMEDVIKHNIPGDVIETGVWRGGATIFMRAILKAYNCTNRTVWVADSFEGLPAPDEIKYPHDRGLNLHLIPYLAVSLEQVQSNFKKYDLLDDQVRFLKGWFKDTLPMAPIGQLAILRLDGDLYESTMDALHALYDKLSVGGYVIVDDYMIPACAQAISDFRNDRDITDELIDIDGVGVYWKKTKS